MNDEAVLQVLQSTMLAHAKAEEERIDAQVQAIDNMGEDDFEKLREKRRQQLKKAHEQKLVWKSLGHGSERPINFLLLLLFAAVVHRRSISKYSYSC
jgi:hypothetical protein